MTGTKPDERIRTPMRWTADPATAGFTTGTPWEALSEDDAASVNVDGAGRGPGQPAGHVPAPRPRAAANPALQAGATIPARRWRRARHRLAADGRRPDAALVVNVSDEPVTDYGLTLDGGPLCGR